MGTMIYNGASMPDIETVWTDKATYPYSYISRLGPQYTLALLTTTFYVNASGTIMYWSADGSGATYTADINTDTGEVGDWVFERTFTYSKGGWSTGPAIEPVTWHSFDVYNSGGTLYSATTAPVDPDGSTDPDEPDKPDKPEEPPEPEYSYDRTAFLSGLAMGLTGQGDPVFTAADAFGKGYIAGAALRKNRAVST